MLFDAWFNISEQIVRIKLQIKLLSLVTFSKLHEIQELQTVHFLYK